ncbi:MAG: hypothetical protein SGCHY_004209 [Lobulomycetales sp.]
MPMFRTLCTSSSSIPIWRKLDLKQKQNCVAVSAVVVAIITISMFNDNDNGFGQFSTATIAFPRSRYPQTIHEIATEDLGTFERPSTFAADDRVYSIGEKIYIPRLKKYFILEDGCVICSKDASKGKGRVDIFIGGNQGPQDAQALRSCQRSLTRQNEVIVRNPAGNLPVDETRLYLEGRGCYTPS